MKPLFLICCMVLAVMASEDQKALETLLHDGNNKFTTNMFKEVAKANPDKSMVISAFSVLTPLAQLALASVGESHDQLLDAIGMPNDNVTKEVFSLANTRVRSIKDVILKQASKIYVAKGFELNTDFASVTKQTFDSEVQNIDFTLSQSAANEMNTWVEQQTNNRIKDLVDPDNLNSDTRAVLLNAIYFKGEWEAKFDKELTRERDFHVNNKITKKVPMMYRRGDYKYGESAELNSLILSMPYKGGETSLVIVLPNEIEGIVQLKEKLNDPKVLDNALANLYEREVDVYLPKFKIETTTDLKDILKKMHVDNMFSAQKARLNNLLKNMEDNLYIDSATQKAFIEVNEEGAEAGAANVFTVVGLSAFIPKQPVQFRADHPFLFFLLDNTNILFNGIYYL
ncbi:antichymotrypsin-2 isoform X4 [Bicyclus anynana]|uniref:Antichymotrypsin-2 isoform X4 n=1 Tax=Bicyclus anynana TaxID=110368 RepID=A0A6J1NXC9_BICAN|nr:antichymotrypsin-2 isoform X4 [Bicyclus anynana]XP_023951375.2 antichymotrypsin-2 isoform X4 [Bicyclus anynana]